MNICVCDVCLYMCGVEMSIVCVLCVFVFSHVHACMFMYICEFLCYHEVGQRSTSGVDPLELSTLCVLRQSLSLEPGA